MNVCCILILFYNLKLCRKQDECKCTNNATRSTHTVYTLHIRYYGRELNLVKWSCILKSDSLAPSCYIMGKMAKPKYCFVLVFISNSLVNAHENHFVVGIIIIIDSDTWIKSHKPNYITKTIVRRKFEPRLKYFFWNNISQNVFTPKRDICNCNAINWRFFREKTTTTATPKNIRYEEKKPGH